jgi:hypothetical protein
MTPPPDALQYASVRAVHGAYSDAMQAALRLIETLRQAGEVNHADAWAADVMKLSRRARLHMARLAKEEQRKEAVKQLLNVEGWR